MPRSVSLHLPAALVALAASALPAWPQASTAPSLDERGQVTRDGHLSNYLVRNLPITSFPELPPEIASALAARGCVVPQTYEAKRPENVIHGSFERAGSKDWAVLCSAGEEVSLLVFLESGAVGSPAVLAARRKLSLLQTHDATGEMGFDWGIDPATPRQVHDAQATLSHRPPAPDHDCVEEIEIDRRTIYHLYKDGAWQTVPTE